MMHARLVAVLAFAAVASATPLEYTSLASRRSYNLTGLAAGLTATSAAGMNYSLALAGGKSGLGCAEGTAVCQHDTNGDTIACGKQASVDFSDSQMTAAGLGLVATYTGGLNCTLVKPAVADGIPPPPPYPRASIVHFVCDTTGAAPRIVSVVQEPECIYNFVVATHLACAV